MHVQLDYLGIKAVQMDMVLLCQLNSMSLEIFFKSWIAYVKHVYDNPWYTLTYHLVQNHFEKIILSLRNLVI